MDPKNEQLAVFWCDLLRPILYSEIPPEETNRYLKNLAQEPIVYPDGKCKKPSLSTLKRKLAAYRIGGFDALGRKPRNDQGEKQKCR